MTFTEHLTAGLAAAWDCKPDEVQHRLATKRRRTGPSVLEREDIAWTAARCNRLLRTITSRINILRRLAKLPAVEREASDFSSTQDRSSKKPSAAAKPRRLSRVKDPEWMPDGSTKAACRTYGDRAKVKPAQVKRKSNEPGFTTPFVKRLMNADLTAIPSEKRQNPDSLPARQRQLPVKASSVNEEAQRNLVTAFASALDATAAPCKPTRMGAPSLMSSCLRRIPQYVELEVSELDEDEARMEDVTSEIFAELEGMGTKADGGWQGLREVVRASCMFHVSNAIEGGLVSGDRVSELVDACSRRDAVREAHFLLQAWLDRHAAISKQQLKFEHPALRRLLTIQQSHDATELYLRTMSDLVENDWLSADDCFAPDRATLTILTKALVRGRTCDVASMFLETALLAEAKDRSAAARQRPSARLASVLTAVSLARRDSEKSDVDDCTIPSIHRAALSLLAYVEPLTGLANLSTRPFVLASFLLSLSGRSCNQTVLSLNPALFTTALTHRAFTDSLVEFACSTAANLQRLVDVNAVTAAKSVTSGLVTPPATLGNRAAEKLRMLHVEIALAFANRVGVDVDPALLDLDQASGHSIMQIRTPRRNPSVTGYKWENGLCEWIAATPFPTRTADDAADNQSTVGTAKEGLAPSLADHQSIVRAARTPSPRKPRVASVPSLEPSSRSKQLLSPDILATKSPNIRIQQQANILTPEEGGLDTGKPKTTALEVKRAGKVLKADLKETVPRQTLKRSHSVATLGKNRVPLAMQVVEVDELGIPTPAKKKVRASSGACDVVQTSKRKGPGAQRRSLPVRKPAYGVMSDDELGQ